MAAPINPVPQGMFSEDEIDGLCDWYDQALASGQGFQSEEERQKYFDDMGDPLSHPLFAGNTEDMEGHELVEAFRCLREEDKSAVELAVMYKEEGNEWMKKKVKKDLKEAIIRYSHALKFLDEADKEASEGVSECVEEEEEPRVVELVDECQEQQCEDTHTVTHTVTDTDTHTVTDTDTDTHTQQCDTHVVSSSNNVLRSQILNNRALASMHLKNYGTALSDINMALLLWPENIKAHFRKCKCLLALTTKRRADLALHAAQAGLSVDPTNADLLKLLTQCEKAVAVEEKKMKEALERQQQLEAGWTQAWTIATNRKVSFGCPSTSWHHPPQLSSPLPFYAEVEDPDADAGAGVGGKLVVKDQWPMVVLYPQHRQLDVIQGVDPSTMLVMLLAEMFPEPEDGAGHSQAVHWDTEREYFVSNLVVYVHMSSCKKFKNCEEWLEYNRQAVKKSSSIEIRDDDDEFSNISAKPDSKSDSGNISISEVHLGCTIDQILKAKNHILEGGLLSLMVFPKANTAPSDVYLKKFGGRQQCGLLSPVG